MISIIYNFIYFPLLCWIVSLFNNSHQSRVNKVIVKQNRLNKIKQFTFPKCFEALFDFGLIFFFFSSQWKVHNLLLDEDEECVLNS